MTLISKLYQAAADAYTPPPKYTVSEWADAERRLSSEASSEPGRWRTARAPYQRGIMDAVNDPNCEMVVFMSSAQVGKTELLLNTIGYYVDYDPSPIMLLQPTLEMAQAFSKDRLSPMVRDTPAIKSKISDSKARDTGNTILHKSFPGGHITMAGANSPASLASRPIRILLADEVDRFPITAGAEGDPFSLAKKRTTTFWNKKILAVSTPTVKNASRIETLYDDSSQERYHLPCPECGELQPLKWANISFDPVGHACDQCGVISSQNKWLAKPGEWIADNPDHSYSRGFHLNELVSPWRRWEQIIEDFKEAKKSPDTLKVWVNTSLGETWEEEGEKADHDELSRRREQYNCDVPRGGLVLTAAADVQDDRIECEVQAWGINDENWRIDLAIFHGDPSKPDVWVDLDNYLLKTYENEAGHTMRIASAFVDSGGHFTQQVYQFCKPREGRRIFAIKGKGGTGTPIVSRPSTSNKGRVKLFSVGVDTAKELVMSRLMITDPGAGYCHFPIKPCFDDEFFLQLTAEERRTRFVKGYSKIEWHKTRKRNEAFDLAVYNLACKENLNPNYTVIAEKLETKEETEDNTEKPQVKKRRRMRVKGF